MEEKIVPRKKERKIMQERKQGQTASTKNCCTV
jgi:hypothetical protein